MLCTIRRAIVRSGVKKAREDGKTLRIVIQVLQDRSQGNGTNFNIARTSKCPKRRYLIFHTSAIKEPSTAAHYCHDEKTAKTEQIGCFVRGTTACREKLLQVNGRVGDMSTTKQSDF